MWCSSSDNIATNNGVPKPHHRIVRIPPGEAVVLNSAERAPYLLLIEVLSDDLDFDPARRSNKEILRKVVNKEVEQRGGSWMDFGLSSASSQRPDADGSLRTPFTAIAQTPFLNTPTTATSTTSTFSNDDEEIDLVEQLFGDDQPLRTRILDIEESIVLPPTPKNRELDMVAWARSSPSMPFEDSRSLQPPRPLSRAPSLGQSSSASTSPQTSTSFESDSSKMLSLDEYSDRMRTAAIMLAQLNADHGRDPQPTSKANGTPRPEAIDRSSEGLSFSELHTLTNPKLGSNEVAQPMHTRLKLPRAEASAIRDRIMKEMLSLEEERMERMKGSEGEAMMRSSAVSGSMKSAEDEGIIRRELNKVDPSAVVFSESWTTKKVITSVLKYDVQGLTTWRQSRIRHGSPYGHLGMYYYQSALIFSSEGTFRFQSQLGLCFGHCQDWRRPTARTTCSAAHSRVCRHLGRRKMCLLG